MPWFRVWTKNVFIQLDSVTDDEYRYLYGVVSLDSKAFSSTLFACIFLSSNAFMCYKVVSVQHAVMFKSILLLTVRL